MTKLETGSLIKFLCLCCNQQVSYGGHDSIVDTNKLWFELDDVQRYMIVKNVYLQLFGVSV